MSAVSLWIQGMRRSGTTILYDALLEDGELRCFYEPLREEDVTEGGGSGARPGDAFAETRERRRRFRDERFPDVAVEDFNWGGPRDPALELEPELPEHCLQWLRSLLQEDGATIKETRLHHKVAALAELEPGAIFVHLVRDPRAVAASTLLGRRRRFDLYPDAAAFFERRTDRKLWSSRAMSEVLIERGAEGLEPDSPDVMRPLAVWRAAFEATEEQGRRAFGDRHVLMRLEDLSLDPERELWRIYERLDRELPDQVANWAMRNVRRAEDVHLGDDPRWDEALRRLGMERALDAAGYAASLGV
jgi:Sulfotransferase family